MNKSETSFRTPAFADEEISGRPRDAVELELRALWSRQLGVRAIRVRDNFFELGGTSFEAVTLLASITSRFGVDITLRDFVQEPTIAGTAERIRLGAPATGTGPVLLQRGTGGPCLYMLPPLSGTLVRYVTLVSALPERFEVHGFESPGLVPGEQPLTTMEGLAKHFAHGIGRRSPDVAGLVGYSMGGHLAVETARRLTRRGTHVLPIALIDTGTRPSSDGGFGYAMSILVKTAIRVPIDLDELAVRPRREQLDIVLRAGQKAGTLPVDAGRDVVEKMLQLYITNSEALANYRPRPIDADVILFRARHRRHAGDDVRSLGWDKLARTVEVHDFDTDHFHLLEPVHAKRIAEVLTDVYDKEGA